MVKLERYRKPYPIVKVVGKPLTNSISRAVRLDERLVVVYVREIDELFALGCSNT